MLLKEIGAVSTILPFKTKFGGLSLDKHGLDVKDIISKESIFDQIDIEGYVVTNEKIKDSFFSRILSESASVLGYKDIKSFFNHLKNVIRLNNNKKLIYGYWNRFDSIAHEHGVKSMQASHHFLRLNLELKSFLDDIKGTDTTVIITSDHGFIDSTEKKNFKLKDYTNLREFLTLPPCGDSRVIYFYVHPSKEDKFVDYWENELSEYSYLFRSEKIMERNYFGLYEINPNLLD
ncbi:MAG: alkaline phosphatase family protein [Thermoplasmatota archaeon]